VSRLSTQCWIFNISQPYKPPRPVTGIALLYFTSFLLTLPWKVKNALLLAPTSCRLWQDPRVTFASGGEFIWRTSSLLSFLQLRGKWYLHVRKTRIVRDSGLPENTAPYPTKSSQLSHRDAVCNNSTDRLRNTCEQLSPRCDSNYRHQTVSLAVQSDQVPLQHLRNWRLQDSGHWGSGICNKCFSTYWQ
jgi:hypothetical protein